jgi:hypothetical protein
MRSAGGQRNWKLGAEDEILPAFAEIKARDVESYLAQARSLTQPRKAAVSG